MSPMSLWGKLSQLTMIMCKIGEDGEGLLGQRGHPEDQLGKCIAQCKTILAEWDETWFKVSFLIFLQIRGQ